MKDFTHIRNILLDVQGKLYLLGEFTQIFKHGSHDFYFEPPYRQSNELVLDHLSLHNSGQLHLKFVNTKPDILHKRGKNALPFEEIGACGYFYMEGRTELLPNVSSKNEADIVIDWQISHKYFWVETGFVNSEFLNQNNFGYPMLGGGYINTYIGKKMIAVGGTNAAEHTVFIVSYGYKSSTDIEDKIKFMPISGQFTKDHKANQ